MNAHIDQELQHLSAAEKYALGQALIGSAMAEADLPQMTDAQRAELHVGLAQHRANSNEQGLSFSQLRGKLQGTPH